MTEIETGQAVRTQDRAAARDVLWPDRDVADSLSQTELQLLDRVAQALSDLSADAEDAWRHAREAERELEQLRGRLTPAGTPVGQVYLGGAWREVGLLGDEDPELPLPDGVRGALRMLHEEASRAVSRGLTQAYAVGLSEGEKKKTPL